MIGMIIVNLILLVWMMILTYYQRETRNSIDKMWDAVARIADDMTDREDEDK